MHCSLLNFVVSRRLTVVPTPSISTDYVCGLVLHCSLFVSLFFFVHARTDTVLFVSTLSNSVLRCGTYVTNKVATNA